MKTMKMPGLWFTGACLIALLVAVVPAASASPDFTISASEAAFPLRAPTAGPVGGTYAVEVTVNPIDGFTGAVTVSAAVAPAGPTLALDFRPNPVVFPAISGLRAAPMTVTAPPGTAAGAYTVTITGTSGSLVRTTTVTAHVFASADPTLPLPSMLKPKLKVQPVIPVVIPGGTGLITPIGMAFLGSNDWLVIEKNTGKVKRVQNGVVNQTAVLDLAVSNGFHKGLLSIALHPNFQTNGYVYLFWSERYSTPATPGEDSAASRDVALLGSRLDRFVWNGSTLTFDRNIIKLRSLSTETLEAGANVPPTAEFNHGGKIGFGPDGKLFVMVGDHGRRGWMQNITDTSVFTPSINEPKYAPFDDQFGGPYPDNAHLTGVILRLNDDGGTPTDNPFYAFTSFDAAALGVPDTTGDPLADHPPCLTPPATCTNDVTTSQRYLGHTEANLQDEVAANIRKVYTYGFRNNFTLDFDPVTGTPWIINGGEDTGEDFIRLEPGANLGWIQIHNSPDRYFSDFKIIEQNLFNSVFEQTRWPPSLLSNDPLSQLFVLPGSVYLPPVFSGRFGIPPAGFGFVKSNALGKNSYGDILLVGGATVRSPLGGALLRYPLTGNRDKIAHDDPRLDDQVIDNLGKEDLTEAEEFLLGRDFGTAIDVQTAPDGKLYVISISKGQIYELSVKK